MTAQQNGLRFDIYERVHLSEGVLGIKELEQVELVPHIQVLPFGEQAILRGNLLLTGSYVDEQERTSQTLEHLIPVEITLPMNRVHRVEDISVDIENFDVDLLSARSLNVTGVLSLNGLEVVSAAENETWNEAEEEVVFIHEAGERLPKQEEEPQAAALDAVSQAEHVFAGQQMYGDLSLARPVPAETVAVSSFDTAWETEPASKLAAEPVAEPVQASGGSDQFEEPAVVASAGVQEPKEMKIALGSKQDHTEAVPIVKSYGLTSLLNQSASLRPGKRVQDEIDAAAAAVSEKVEWKNLLLSARTEQQQFKRLRMCIVQKNETLESIAKRYEMNPREIALYNRLGDNDVSVGQIVYIPR